MALSVKLQSSLLDLGLNPDAIAKLVSATIAEDLAGGIDLTSVATVSELKNSTAVFRSRSAGVIAGLHVAAAVLESCGITKYEIESGEGEFKKAGSLLVSAEGSTRNLLLAERTALNFLGRVSGISTLTKEWVDAVAGLPTQIRDTRKTTPLLRELEKFAVRMGGGVNHRISLSESVLIKDNHIAAADGLTKAFEAVKNKFPEAVIEVEVDSLEQLLEALEAGVKFLLLDNMSVIDCKHAVEIVGGRAKLEASGGLTLVNARSYAETGVDYLAVGALTHSAPVLDIGLDFGVQK